MDGTRTGWYFSRMTALSHIPDYALLGEHTPLPDVIHMEPLTVRAPAREWKISPHRHGEMAQILALSGGQAVAQIEGGRHPLGPGDLLYLPAQIVHSFDFAPGSEGWVITLPWALVTGLLPAGTELDSGPLVTPTPTPLLTLLQTTYQGQSLHRTHALLGLTQALLATLAEAVPTPAGRPAGRLRHLDDLIATHRATWPPHRYAQALGLSLSQLSRITKAARGLSAQSLIERAVMTEACRLLAFTDLPVAEVGYRMGFPDPSYFTRRFRKSKGEAPSAYRARFG